MPTLKKQTNILNYTKHSKEQLYKQGIYCLYYKNKPNIFYVGYASITNHKRKDKQGFNGRWLKHLSDLRRNKHHSQFLQNTYNKYGQFDCDNDGHKYGTYCRTCEAAQIVERLKL